MTVDALVMVGENLFGPTQSLQEALAGSAALGIDTVVVAPARPHAYALPPANDDVAAAAAVDEGSVGVWRLGRVDPRQGPAAVAEARRCLTTLGCVGLFLHPGEECFTLNDASPVVRVAGELGRPVVVAAGVPRMSEPLQFLELAAEVPDAHLVMTNGGHVNISGLAMSDAWAALERSRNLRILSNGTYRQDFLERVVRELGPERLLFGSFAPCYSQQFELARVRALPLDLETRELVEGGNARGLLRAN
jgi:predicted TIM-barrel fold metal-dependent hydrolase